MSSVTRSVLCGSFVELMPQNIFCMISIRRVFVECRSLKPCCNDLGQCIVG